MSRDPGRAVWRVSARDGTAQEEAFDALVLPHDTSPSASGQRHIGLPLPYEGQFPDIPQTLIVHARPGAGPLSVEYRGYGTDGSLQIVGRGALPLVVIVRSATGIQVTGLPDGALESLAPAT